MDMIEGQSCCLAINRFKNVFQVSEVELESGVDSDNENFDLGHRDQVRCLLLYCCEDAQIESLRPD